MEVPGEADVTCLIVHGVLRIIGVDCAILVTQLSQVNVSLKVVVIVPVHNLLVRATVAQIIPALLLRKLLVTQQILKVLAIQLALVLAYVGRPVEQVR